MSKPPVARCNFGCRQPPAINRQIHLQVFIFSVKFGVIRTLSPPNKGRATGSNSGFRGYALATLFTLPAASPSPTVSRLRTPFLNSTPLLLVILTPSTASAREPATLSLLPHSPIPAPNTIIVMYCAFPRSILMSQKKAKEKKIMLCWVSWHAALSALYSIS